LKALNLLRARGNSLVVVEHDETTMRQADHIIDLGPEGGDKGGHVVASGTPEEIADAPASHTGRYLRRVLTDPRAHIAITSEHEAVEQYERANRELLQNLENTGSRPIRTPQRAVRS
jgi:excinuclease ABC subunit A